MRSAWLATSLALAGACVDLPALRDRGYTCDAGDARCEAEAGREPVAGSDGGSGSGRMAEDGGDAASPSDAASASDAAGASDAGADGDAAPAADGGVDCDAIEDGCVDDADFIRTLLSAMNACGFTCSHGPRGCAQIADGFCPQACTYRGDADCPRPNRLFVTKTAYDGDLGGLAGADAKCQASADDAGLNGTFIALLGTSSVPAEVRLGSARGFVRLDGEPLADQASDLLAGALFTAPNLNEDLHLMPPETFVATGFARAGEPTFVCGDWTSDSDSNGADFGLSGMAGAAWRAFGGGGCEHRLHLYCTEVSKQIAVRPRAVPNTRKAFVAEGFDPSTGVVGADETCMAAADDADLDGTFKAFVATADRAPIARFDLEGQPWARIDGTLIVDAAADLGRSRLRAPLNQSADGTYLDDGRAFTGTNDARRTALESCKDWTSNAAHVTAQVGRIVATDASFLSDAHGSTLSCANQSAFVYCLEEEGDGRVPSPPDDAEPNVVFVTREAWNGDFGGLSGADASCQAAADSGGLDGNFIALLSTATARPEQRLGTTRGFVRTDGAPVADTARDLVSGRLLVPIDRDEDGNALDGLVRTGARSDCDGFSSSAADVIGSNATASASAPLGIAQGYGGCDVPMHLFCASTGHEHAIVRPSTAGRRLAFVARGSTLRLGGRYSSIDPGVGLAGLDAQCMLEAAEFGLPGTFGAFVATASASAASRFDGGRAPWARVDGPLLAATAAALLSDGTVVSLNVAADGLEYFDNTAVWFGANSASSTGTQTCDGWSTNASTASGLVTLTGRSGAFTATQAWGCDANYVQLFCLQY